LNDRSWGNRNSHQGPQGPQVHGKTTTVDPQDDSLQPTNEQGHRRIYKRGLKTEE